MTETTALPRSGQLETLRKELGQERTPAYGDALRLCRTLEAEVARLTAALATANAGFEQFERRSYLLSDRVELLETSLRECAAWMTEAVQDVCYPLAHEASSRGVAAEGLGSTSVALLTQANHVLNQPKPE